MNIINRRIDTIIPYEYNTKKHDDRQISNVAESIKQFGFVQPVVIDADGVIVIGHCRVLAAKKLGMKEVPCVCVDDLTPEQVNALRIVDNKSNESEWDWELLETELSVIDLSTFEFDFGIENIEENFEEFDESGLDEEVEKTNVIISINCDSVKDYESIKDRISVLADEIGATMAVKMA